MNSTKTPPNGLDPSPPLLDVRGLDVEFSTPGGLLQAVRNVSFVMGRGEIVALVGESGSGKSTIGLALMRLIEREARARISGTTLFQDKTGKCQDLMAAPEAEMRQIRGNDIAMIFQEPMSSLNPIFTIGGQIIEAIRTHQDLKPRQARSHALEMLHLLGIPNPESCLTSYPHQISGGMRQRAMIAMALSCNPSLLIADEPTTALDVTIQAQIIEHLKQLQAQTGMSILFITHDLGLVSEIADRVLVLYAGQIVELGTTAALFGDPLMPYTQALLASLPRLGRLGDPDYQLYAIPGNVPSALDFPQGCAFHPRCAHFAETVCDAAEPVLATAADGHCVRCIRWQEIQGDRPQ